MATANAIAATGHILTLISGRVPREFPAVRAVRNKIMAGFLQSMLRVEWFFHFQGERFDG